MSLMWNSSPSISIVKRFSIFFYPGVMHNLFINVLHLSFAFIFVIYKYYMVSFFYHVFKSLFSLLFDSLCWWGFPHSLVCFFLFFFRCIEKFTSIFIPVWVFFSISMSLVNYFHVLNCCHYFIHQFMWVFFNSTRSYVLSSLNSFGCLFMSSLNSLTSF